MTDDVTRDAALWRLTKYADAQRFAATALHEAVTLAHTEGLSFRTIADTIGLPRETLFRQWSAGTQVVVVRGMQKKEEP